jgi:hypothetical protein
VAALDHELERLFLLPTAPSSLPFRPARHGHNRLHRGFYMSVYDDYADIRIRLIGTKTHARDRRRDVEQEGHEVGWMRREVALSEELLDATSFSDEVS